MMTSSMNQRFAEAAIQPHECTASPHAAHDRIDGPVRQLIEQFASAYTKREFMEILNPLDVPCGPIMSTGDLANDEHVRGRDMYVELDHPQRGKWWNVGMPIKLSASPAVVKRSPTLGEHTDEILREVLGFSDAQIEAKKQAGAFSMPPKKK